MKIHRTSICISAALVGALIQLAPGAARAVSAPLPASTSILNVELPTFSLAGGSDQPQFQCVGWEEARRHKLREVYWLLEQGDRDYRGHRAKAMEHIRKAGDIIGMDLHGDGYGGKRQVWSDERLREARGVLKGLAEDSRGREFDQIREAIKEIDKALAST